jgi:hypothetical protein
MSLAYGQTTRSTDPGDFADVLEQPLHGQAIAIKNGNAEVDDRSIIEIRFHSDRMALPSAESKRPQVHIRVEAYSSKGGKRSPIAPIPHFVDQPTPPPLQTEQGTRQETGGQNANPLKPASQTDPAGQEETGGLEAKVNPPKPPSQAEAETQKKPGGEEAKAKPETQSSGTIVYHDKYFNPQIGAIEIPNTEINLRETQVADADFIEVRITNLWTQQSLVKTLTPVKFGFRTKVSDTFLLVKRIGIHGAERASGFDPSNFSPAPGVTYGGVFTARNRAGRFLQPGVGVNVSFLTWSDPAISKTTGQPTPGTSASSVQVGTGAMLTFFSDALQFTLGGNLNADRHRVYWGIGFSFVNLAERIKGSK